MSKPQVAAQQLAGTALAPAGSQLVLAEWTAQGITGDEPLYHRHRCMSTQKTRPGTCSRERWPSAPASTSTRYQPEAR